MKRKTTIFFLHFKLSENERNLESKPLDMLLNLEDYMFSEKLPSTSNMNSIDMW